MKATTIKIEGSLLNDLNLIRPKHMSFSAFVRQLLEHDIQREKMSQASEKYLEFLAANPEEAEEMNQWEAADLGAITK